MRSHHAAVRHVSLVALPLLLAGASAACRNAEPAAVAAPAAAAVRRVDVPALTVARTTVESSMQISGDLAPESRVAIVAKLSGTLATIGFDIGDRVRAGQTVATLDQREIDAQVDAASAAVKVATAALESAEAGLANAALELDRSKKLFDAGALPRQRLDAAETARRAAAAGQQLAQANIAQAEAALRRARETQRDATLTSPIDGVVVERNYDAGSLVGPGQKPLLVIADMRVMKLEAGVSELEAGRLSVGMPVRVAVQARPGDTFTGRLATITPEVDAKNRHFAVQVRTSNPGPLLAGMYATATIPLARAADVVAIPRDALATRGDKHVVLKIEGTTIREVPVTEGVTDGALVQVLDGLQAGDVIVSDARRQIPPGEAVNPVFTK